MPCDPEEICEECPEWIFTLADLLMCMMGLFVILWSSSPTAAGARRSRSSPSSTSRCSSGRSSSPSAARRTPTGRSASPTSSGSSTRSNATARGERGTSTREADGAEGTDPEVTRIRDGELAGLGGRVHFEAGSAELSPRAAEALGQIAAKIRGHRNVVLVRGHTSPDDLDPADAAGADPLDPRALRRRHVDLSLARARAVAEALIAAGVAPEVLRPQACAAYEPVKLRAYSPDDRRLNRRVEVEATDQLVSARAAAAR